MVPGGSSGAVPSEGFYGLLLNGWNLVVYLLRRNEGGIRDSPR